MISGLRRVWQCQRESNAKRVATVADIRGSETFRTALDELADRHGRERADVEVDAARYLDEIVTVHSEALPDFNLLLSRIADARGFEGVVQYDESAVERLRACNEKSPLVMMTGHRSYLDFVVRVPFARRGFAREFRFAGANNLFWPMGSIGHHAGIIFIRRGFRDPVYTYALRYYVGWLTEHRANFLWALEGGRSRTGKLLPPKAGLLAYVADAYADGRTADVTLVPATVVYEYLDEVYEYARYGRGASKAAENLLFMVRLARTQRRVPPEAMIHIGIGEPVSLATFVERKAGGSGDDLSASIMRAAIEVSRRIEAATPITGVALVLWVLLERDGVKMRVDELVATLAPVVAEIDKRKLPAPEPCVGGPANVRRALDLLTTQGLVAIDGRGKDAEYRVVPGRHLEAAYYRNAIVHHFAIQGIVEVALAMTAAADHGDDESTAVFWRNAGVVRDVLEREFFFPEGAAFGEAVAEAAQSRIGAWEEILARPAGAHALLDRLHRPYVAPRTLAPFLEAHKIVAGGLHRLGSQPVVDDRMFLRDCLARAELDLELGHLRHRDAASLNMLEPALKAAKERGLVRGPVGDSRRGWVDTLTAVLGAIPSLDTPAIRR